MHIYTVHIFVCMYVCMYYVQLYIKSQNQVVIKMTSFSNLEFFDDTSEIGPSSSSSTITSVFIIHVFASHMNCID